MKTRNILFFLALTGVSILFHTIAASALSGTATSAGSVKEYFITCDPDSFENIYQHYEEDIYIPATITYQDNTWTNVRLRLRGDSSRELPKKSLKLKFDGEPFADGRDVLNFNAEYLDKSFIHSILASHLFALTEHPCFEAEPARLYLNGKFLGLYIRVENMDEAFLTARGLSPKGNLYKATHDGACLNAEDDGYTFWEKKTNEGTSHKDLQELIHKLNVTPDTEFSELAHQLFDYEKLVNIIALNILLSNGSTYYHNYYMYHNPADGKWMMLPWDMDKTFSSYGTHYPYSRVEFNSLIGNALLCKPILQDVRIRLQEIAGTYFTPEYLFPIVDSLQLLLSSSVEQDTTDRNTDVNSWKQYLTYERDYIQNRYTAINNQFAHHPDVFRINNAPSRVTPGEYLTWHPSSDPNTGEVSYLVRISRHKFIPEAWSQSYTDIRDTFFIVPELTSGMQYFWTVEASDGQNRTQGYTHAHSFLYSLPTLLASPVRDTTILTAVNSPYIVDGDLIIESGALLKAEPGVELRLPHTHNIIVRGALQFEGSASEPVHIRSTSGTLSWGQLFMESGSAPSTLSHVIITHGGPPEVTEEPESAKISAVESNLTVDSVDFFNCYRCIYTKNSQVTIRNCYFSDDNFGEPIEITGGTTLIENCVFYNAAGAPSADAIDLEGVQDAVIRNNRIHGTRDDGIDIGSSTALIENNFITHCLDNGISIGEGSHTTLHGNTVAFCRLGVGIKGVSQASVNRQTVYASGYGCGVDRFCSVDITNSIFSQSTSSTLYFEDSTNTQFTLRYSLSDTEELAGIGTLRANPLFVDAAGNNFRLRPDSPCIDAGDPQSTDDPDGTRADMGAFYFNKSSVVTAVVINEISYNQPDEVTTGDWVELYNPDTAPINVSGWTFKDADDDHVFTLPTGTFIAPQGYLVLCEDTAGFRQLFPDVHPIMGNTGFGLSGSGELIRLFNNTGDIVDSLTYDDTEPWPLEADGTGPTLELISASYDNALGQSWKASQNSGGTPGKRNSATTDSVGEPQENQLYFLQQNYPNPFSGTSTIGYILLTPAHVTIEVYNTLGQPVRTLFEAEQGSGAFSIPFDATGLSSGHYLYGLRINGQLVVVKSAIVIE